MQARRVVTVHDANGRAVIESDGAPATFRPPDTPDGVTVSVLWVTHQSPPRFDDGEERASPAWQLGAIPVGGTRWSMIELQPGANARGMHRTDTVDYVEIRSGEIWLVLGGGEEVHLTAGDCVVQRGTEHAWENRSTEPCVMTSVMLNASRAAPR